MPIQNAIDLRNYAMKVQRLSETLDLDHLCSCQLTEIAKAIEHISPVGKEEFLAIVYLESLLLGIVYSHDFLNYDNYIEAVGGKRIMMVQHGTAEIQFRMLLLLPQYASSFDQETLNQSLRRIASSLLPLWLERYAVLFGESAKRNLMQRTRHDSDLKRLLDEFPFLKEQFSTTFGLSVHHGQE